MAARAYDKVLITGASSGIGRAMALWWVKRGATVWATARRTANLEELAKEGEGRIHAVAMDVVKEAETVAKIQAIDAECGGLDLVIANAGVGGPTPAQFADWALVEPMLRTNVMGAAATLTAVLPRMLQRGRGHVAAVSSVAGYVGYPAHAAYSASKAFLSTFLEGLRVDVSGTPVKVTCIEPGFVKSEMSAKDSLTPMPFIAETADAADVFGRAIVRGARVIAWPRVHAWGSALLRWMPAAIYERLGKRSTRPHVAQLEARLQRKS